MQRVAEFVEECTRIVKRKKRGLTFGRFGEVADIIDDRDFSDRTIFQRLLVLRLERTHPCA